jgi:hypothetical protein
MAKKPAAFIKPHDPRYWRNLLGTDILPVRSSIPAPDFHPYFPDNDGSLMFYFVDFRALPPLQRQKLMKELVDKEVVPPGLAAMFLREYGIPILASSAEIIQK